MNTVPASAKNGPNSGLRRISCLAMPTKSRCSSLHRMSMSRPLWWLKMKTAGRCDQRCSSPLTRRRMPASALPSSPNVVPARLTTCRQLPSSTPAGSPSRNDGTRLPTASDVRTTSSTPGMPRVRERPAGPATPDRDRGEPPVRIGGARIADLLEQRQVLVAVGVEEALGEIDAAAGGETARRFQLSLAVAQRRRHGAGEPAVAHLEAAAQHVLDAQVAGDGLDLVARGRGDDREGVVAAAMRAHDGAGLGIDLRGDAVGVQALAHLQHRGLGLALQQGGGLGEQIGELQLAELEAQTGHGGERQPRRTDAPAHQAVEEERHDGEAGDQGTIEVEEGPDGGPRGSLVDLPRDVVEPRHGPRSIASRPRRGQPMPYPAGGGVSVVSTPGMAVATQQQEREEVGARRVVFLLDACSGIERRILRQWILEHHVPTGIPYEMIPIPADATAPSPAASRRPSRCLPGRVRRSAADAAARGLAAPGVAGRPAPPPASPAAARRPARPGTDAPGARRPARGPLPGGGGRGGAGLGAPRALAARRRRRPRRDHGPRRLRHAPGRAGARARRAPRARAALQGPAVRARGHRLAARVPWRCCTPGGGRGAPRSAGAPRGRALSEGDRRHPQPVRHRPHARSSSTSSTRARTARRCTTTAATSSASTRSPSATRWCSCRRTSRTSTISSCSTRCTRTAIRPTTPPAAST